MERRRIGAALLAFGVIGLMLAGLLALGLVGGAIAARGLDERLEADQARLAQTLDRLGTTLGSVVTTMDNAGATLESSSTTLIHARDVLDQLAATSDELAGALDITILGNQPFVAASRRFTELAARVRVFREDANVLAARLATNAEDVVALSGRLESIETQVGELADRIDAYDRTGEIVGFFVIGILLGGLLAAWLAVAAATCAWVGWRLRNVPLRPAEAPIAPV